MRARRNQMFRPVKLRFVGSTRFRVVRDAHQAIKLLATEWPPESSPAISRATLACLRSFNDDNDPDDVRRAFIAAAQEAHVEIAG